MHGVTTAKDEYLTLNGSGNKQTKLWSDCLRVFQMGKKKEKGNHKQSKNDSGNDPDATNIRNIVVTTQILFKLLQYSTE